MMEGSSEPVQIAARINDEEPRLLEANPAVDPELAAICDRATAHRPEDRYASAQEMQRALEDWLARAGPLPTQAEVAQWMCRRYAEKRSRERALIERQVRMVQSWVSDQKSDVPMIEMGGVSPPITSSTSVRTRMEVPSRTGKARGRRRRRWLGAGALAVGALLLAYLVLPRGESREGAVETAVPRRSVPDAAGVAKPAVPVVPDARPDVLARILIEIATRPSHATLVLDNKPQAENPYRASLPRDDRLHKLEIKAPGYLSETRQLRFKRDISLEIALRRRVVKRGTRGKGASAADASTPTDKQDKPARPPLPQIDTENPYR
jgi:serine/threonine-protein kinase